MSIQLQLSPELESRLRQEAEAAGVGVDRYLSEMLAERLQPGDVDTAETRQSDENWGDRLVAWADGFPALARPVDDSRELIYEDRG